MMDFIIREKQNAHIWLSVVVAAAGYLAIDQITLAVVCLGGGIYLARIATKKRLAALTPAAR